MAEDKELDLSVFDPDGSLLDLDADVESIELSEEAKKKLEQDLNVYDFIGEAIYQVLYDLDYNFMEYWKNGHHSPNPPAFITETGLFVCAPVRTKGYTDDQLVQMFTDVLYTNLGIKGKVVRKNVTDYEDYREFNDNDVTKLVSFEIELSKDERETLWTLAQMKG